MRILPNLFIILLISACSQQDATGPGEVRWDQEVCARCSMAVSDRKFAAQVRGAESIARTRLYKFDDIGCAVIWLDKQPWKSDPRTEIWVADHRDGQWIDARKAWYVTGKHTPMNYGLGAQNQPGDGLLDFTGAKGHIYVAEKKDHMHGGHHQHMVNDREVSE